MINDCNSIEEYIKRHEEDGVLWKASYLLKDVENPILRHERVTEVAYTLSLIPYQVARDDYAKTICKEYNLSSATLSKLIQDRLTAGKKKEQISIPKNKVNQLEGNRCVWPFFTENIAAGKSGEEYKGIEIDLEKFIALLASFGFTRYETRSTSSTEDSFAFVHLNDNVIASVTRQQIIDFVENFIRKDYDFAGAGCRFTDSSIVLNKFYKNMKSFFSKDIFARVRTPEPIIINQDTSSSTFFYYRNGFVEVTKDTWVLHPYSKLKGSVWDTQMLERDFTLLADPIDVAKLTTEEFNVEGWGNFPDFCWKVAGEDKRRFFALCSIIGYLLHDFYDYKLRAILLTDSSMSDASEGRTGKTLLAKMIGFMRSFVELNGKDFDVSNKNKYEGVTPATQVIHLNDVKHKGRNKFDFEDVFNDVTEGIVVNAKYATPFRHNAKIIISTNKTLNIVGASQRDRIVEFEMGQFFGEHLSPQQHYGVWFGRDWDNQQWQVFDNFMCFCAACFLRNGILEVDPINLGERKLRNHTDIAFLEFMDDVKESVESKATPFEGYTHRNLSNFGFESAPNDFRLFVFDKKQLYDKFKENNSDFGWVTQKKFTEWLLALAAHRYGIRKPMEKRSHNVTFFQFQHASNSEA